MAIALAILLITKTLAKKGEIMESEMLAQMKLILKNCELYPNSTLLKI